MKIPQDMTEQEVVDQITKVCDRIAPKYTFYGYTIDDIKQESFMICMDALQRYDQNRPLENFLSVNLSNRLKNFVRDNHFVSTDNDERVKIVQPAQLDYENNIIDNSDSFKTSYDDIELKDISYLLDEHIPAFMRMDYLRMINDVYITKQRKEEIIETVLEILKEHGHYEEGQNL